MQVLKRSIYKIVKNYRLVGKTPTWKIRDSTSSPQFLQLGTLCLVDILLKLDLVLLLLKPEPLLLLLKLELLRYVQRLLSVWLEWPVVLGDQSAGVWGFQIHTLLFNLCPLVFFVSGDMRTMTSAPTWNTFRRKLIRNDTVDF